MSWIQQFRERPRAVVIFAEAVMNALGCELKDARHWVNESQGIMHIVVVLQGRVHEGDWVRMTLTHEQSICWSDNQAVRHLLGKSLSQLRFVIDARRLEGRGWHDIIVHCNGRLAGKARLEVI